MEFVQAKGLLAPTFKGDPKFVRIFEIIVPKFKATRNAVYGFVNGIPVAFSPRYDEFSNQFEIAFEYRESDKKWHNMRARTINFVIMNKSNFVLEHWRSPRPIKSEQELKDSEFWKSEAKNPDVVREKKSNPVSHKLPGTTRDYDAHSKRIYGKSIDMNGKKVRVSGRIGEYLDGKTPVGYRPLNPTFPVKAGGR